MNKRFDIKREAVASLIHKYECYQKDYVLSEAEEHLFTIAPKLSEWERVLWYAMAEYKTVRKIAAYFGTTQHQAYQAMKELKAKVKKLI